MKKVIAIVGVLISLGALYWAARDIDFAAVWIAIQNISLPLFILAFLPWSVSIWAKVERWRLLYYPDQNSISRPRLFSALMIGYLFNTVLPFRTGEVVRATVLRATARLPVPRTLSTILVEKVLDTICLIVGLAIILPFVSLPEAFREPVTLAAILFGGLFVVVLAAALFPQVARGLRDKLLPIAPQRLRPPVYNISEQALNGLIPLRRREVAPAIVAWTVLTWFTSAIATWVLLFSFGIIQPITAPALVLIATNLVMTIPSAPGYIGVFHATAKQALMVFGVNADGALAFATVLHVFGFIPPALLGLFAMIREGLSFANVQQASEKTDNAAPPINPEPGRLRS